MKKPVTGFYPGTFDPITLGHMDIIIGAAKICTKLVIGLGIHPSKKPMFPTKVREEMIKTALQDVQSDCIFEVITFDNLTIETAKRVDAQVLVRGIRDGTDFDYEMQLLGMNHTLNPDIQTVFIPSTPERRHISATLVRQIAEMGSDPAPFVPENTHQFYK